MKDILISNTFFENAENAIALGALRRMTMFLVIFFQGVFEGLLI